MLEVLTKDETGVSHGTLGEIFWLSVPFAYRAGGLNFLNDVAGDSNSLNGVFGGEVPSRSGSGV